MELGMIFFLDCISMGGAPRFFLVFLTLFLLVGLDTVGHMNEGWYDLMDGQDKQCEQ